jgi:hypothetical protein
MVFPLELHQHLVSFESSRNGREGRRRRPGLDGPAPIEDAAVAGTLEHLCGRIPAHAASEVRARGGQCGHLRRAGLDQKHDLAVDYLAISVLARHADRDRRGFVVRKVVDRNSGPPVRAARAEGGRGGRPPEQNRERGADRTLQRGDDTGQESPPSGVRRRRGLGVRNRDYCPIEPGLRTQLLSASRTR